MLPAGGYIVTFYAQARALSAAPQVYCSVVGAQLVLTDTILEPPTTLTPVTLIGTVTAGEPTQFELQCRQMKPGERAAASTVHLLIQSVDELHLAYF